MEAPQFVVGGGVLFATHASNSSIAAHFSRYEAIRVTASNAVFEFVPYNSHTVSIVV
jgi:hypothetical protein